MFTTVNSGALVNKAGLRSRSRSRESESTESIVFPGVGVGVGVDENLPTPTPDKRLLPILKTRQYYQTFAINRYLSDDIVYRTQPYASDIRNLTSTSRPENFGLFDVMPAHCVARVAATLPSNSNWCDSFEQTS